MKEHQLSALSVHTLHLLALPTGTVCSLEPLVAHA